MLSNKPLDLKGPLKPFEKNDLIVWLIIENDMLCHIPYAFIPSSFSRRTGI